jgi:hypothetical protein
MQQKFSLKNIGVNVLIQCIAKKLKVLGVLPNSIKIEGYVINL